MPLLKRAHVCQSSNVVSIFASCPADPEEAADAYLLSRMSPGKVEDFELHLARCSRCSQIVETTRAFIHALRDAAHDLPKTRAATSN
jgi:anti-sigma factor RsiW